MIKNYLFTGKKIRSPVIKHTYRDKIKNEYCLKHNIPLIRIPYWVTPTKEILFSNEFLITKGDD